MIRNVISVIDGAAGSCGKAKLVGEIATDKTIPLRAAITHCMPNAGHTFVDEKGHAIIFRNIPVSSINPTTELFIGPGSAIDMEVFMEEYARVEPYLGDRKIYVHEMVPLIEERHKEYERKTITSGSTFKGCGAVTQEKVIRSPELQFFKGYKNAVVCSNEEWMDRLYSHLDNPNGYVLMEGAQGCDLDLNHSGNYPYVTSRNVSTAQLLADSGISAERLLETLMVIRPFPIRISDVTKDGRVLSSGSYGTGDRLMWTQLNIASMYGGYPCKGDVECFNYHLEPRRIKKLMMHCPKVYLKQLFGIGYRLKKVGEVTLLEALELERLVYKSRGLREYESRILDLSMISSEYPPNTIIDQSEETSVTRMERKLYDLDIQKLQNNCRINTPFGLYLNFYQHLDRNYAHQCGNFEDFYFNRYARNYLDWLESETNRDICALGTGAMNGEKILKKEFIQR